MASGEPTDDMSPVKALHTGVIRKQLGSMRLKNRSTSQRALKIGKRTTMSGFGSSLFLQSLAIGSGRSYLMLEGTDARVHYVYSTLEIEAPRNRGRFADEFFHSASKRQLRMPVRHLR